MREDAVLLAAWREGDRHAGDELIRRHLPMVGRFFRSKLGDDIDDLVQQTFADAVRSRDAVGAAGFRAYLMGIACHRLFDTLRLRARPGGAFDPASTSVADLGTPVSQRIAKRQAEQLMLSALRQLPVEYQTVLELAYWEELTGAEIAAILSISPHTVRSRLARARVALRERLEQSTADPDLVRQSVRQLEQVVLPEDLDEPPRRR